MGQVIDWSLATRLAGFLAGDAGHRPRPSLPALARESEQVVRAYTGLAPDRPLPEAELLDRPAWIEANLRSMRPLMEPLSARTGQGAGPLAPALRGAAGVLLAAEIGVLMGYVSRRVLGQYELVLLDAQAPARLLFVGPNLDEAAREMAVDEDDLLRWVALHEVTHALQFAGVPWLREHLGDLLRSLIGSLEVGLDPSRLLRLPSAEDLRGLVRAVSSGDLLKFVAGPQQLALLDRMQCHDGRAGGPRRARDGRRRRRGASRAAPPARGHDAPPGQPVTRLSGARARAGPGDEDAPVRVGKALLRRRGGVGWPGRPGARVGFARGAADA